MRLKTLSMLSLSALCMLLIPAEAMADNDENRQSATNSVIQRIVTESEGNIDIEIPEDLMDVIFPPVRSGNNNAPKKKAVKANVIHSGVNKLSGYRVQVFSQGHNQASVQARAKARASAVVARFPKYRGQVYTYSSAPNWYTRVGNFQTSAEASRALAELKRAFPQYAGEMRLVKCQITIVK